MLDISSLGKKIWVVGGPGAGKTTISKALSNRFSYAHLELDSFVWEENWKRSDDNIIQDRVQAALYKDSWVADGHYDPVTDMILESCDSIIFLDVDITTRFWRVLSRSISYCFMRKELWNGNKESWGRLFSQNSMPVYVFKSASREAQKNQEIYGVCMKKGKYAFRVSQKKEIQVILKKLRGKS